MKLTSLKTARRLLLLLTAAIFSSAVTAGSVTVNNCGESITFDSVPERMVVHELASPTDYRQDRLAGSQVYFTVKGMGGGLAANNGAAPSKAYMTLCADVQLVLSDAGSQLLE